jgi:hypothetical protein
MVVLAVPGSGSGVHHLAQSARFSDSNATCVTQVSPGKTLPAPDPTCMTALRSEPKRPLSRTTARNAALINQFGTPGLGSLIAGRYAVGMGQLLLFVTGFCLFVAWFVRVMLQLYRQINGGPELQLSSVAWLGEAGAAAAALAWFWSLFTSLSLLRQARSDAHPPGE